ncbi:MAG: response regulator [Lachnospiraceae bacterium]|nr:response regulator [Lachnospiraceae bacterium]
MKEKQTESAKRIDSLVQIVMMLLVVGTYLFFALGETFWTSENKVELGVCVPFEAKWERVMPDGSRVPITVPGEYENPRGEILTIETTIPEGIGDLWFCIRGIQQDYKIYVGEELRAEYSTIDSQMFGKTSTTTYILFEVRKEDAGKTLRMESFSDSAYSGHVDEIIMGIKSEIWSYLIRSYAAATVVAILLMILSMLVVAVCLFINLRYHKKTELVYLGLFMLLASTWMLSESRLRQFLLPNSTIAMYMGFLVIMLLPIPGGLFMNKIQKGRYNRYYVLLSLASEINFIVLFLLQILEIKDFFETMLSSHILLFGLIVLFFVTMFTDLVKGYIKEYKEVAIGFSGLMVMGIFEILMVYSNDAKYNGVPLCIGLLFLLMMSGLKTINDLLRSEKEKQKAIAASESKDMFLANMSHEIRTPINTVIGMNEMILRESKDSSINEYAENIKRASQMLLGIINDILDYSKIEAGKLEIIEGDYVLPDLVKDVIIGSQVRIKQKNLQFITDVEEGLPSVLKGDEIRVKQILNNLLSNATKYTEKGSVSFKVYSEKAEEKFVLCFSIADTGIGIKPKDLEHLYESFLRLELKKNRNVEGTGLGLAIAKQLVEGMDGSMEVLSEYGKGTTFIVKIPQEIVDDTDWSHWKEALSVNSGKSENVKEEYLYAPNANILIVDDNDLNLQVMKGLLKRTGIQADYASGGRQCLESTKNKKYDLILMDHMMPDLDGVETMHMIKEDLENPNHKTVIIVLTANAIAGVEQKYKDEGFDGYLSKPVESDKLEALLKKYLIAEGNEYINFNLGYHYTNNDTELYLESLRIYCEDGEEYIGQLEQYLKEQKWKDYGIVMHSINGTSLAVGAKKIADMAKKHELAANAALEDFLNAEWDNFKTLYRETLQCAADYADRKNSDL